MRNEDILKVLLYAKTNNKETEKDISVVRDIIKQSERRSAVINALAAVGTLCAWWLMTGDHLQHLLNQLQGGDRVASAAYVHSIGGDDDDDERGSGR